MSKKNDKSQELRLGLDVGAINVKAVLVDESGALVASLTKEHKGEIFKTTYETVKELEGAGEAARVGIVGVNARLIADTLNLPLDEEVSATIRGLGKEEKGIRQIIDVGGGSLSLIELTESGQFQGYQTNTLCAAGTGSFLDEQAERMGIRYDELSKLPFIEAPPSVAARCAVFAKSDLIHRQQEGYKKPEMWSGLCKGLANTIMMTLFKGKRPVGMTAMIGGVSLNAEVVRWLTAELSGALTIPMAAPVLTAIGAAMGGEAMKRPIAWEKLLEKRDETAKEAHRPSLELKRSKYPSFDVLEEYEDEERNEVRISKLPESGILSGYLGIDIGSTSTKLMMIDETEEAVLDIYRKTGGDPIGATQSIFRAMRTLGEKRGWRFDIKGVGTTGSGRKLVGAVIGADDIINEITAHVTGAMKTDPSIDTIFEIGGQDSKYIHTVGGHLHNSNMNYVCAAGTGSFVEELSRKMGFEIHTLGDEVMHETPPVTSDRCTVFMEQDARTLLRKGYTPKEVMGAVMYSIVQNYLNKVVGNRYYSKKKVFFQGATARNKGLVAAFENLLGVEVVVSPYAHVMGSFGVALLTKRSVEERGRETRFLGLDFADKAIRLVKEECTLCPNRCQITFAEMEGLQERPSFGYMCGRDAEDTHVKPNKEFAMFKARERLFMKAGTEDLKLLPDAPVIGMPKALLSYTYYPMWRRFFAELGYNLVLSKTTDREIVELSGDWVGSDYCFPVKLMHGHARQLLENDCYEEIFLPYMINAGDTNGKTTEAYFCPYNISIPGLIGSAMELNGIAEERLLKATLDLRWDDKTAAKRLYRDIGKKLFKTQGDIARAWRRARSVQKQFEQSIRDEGKKRVEKILQENRPAVVVVGRPYNVYDPGANLSLPEKIGRMGFPVIPMDFLPLDGEDIGEEFGNMFWNYGRKIIEATRYVARMENLYIVYFSNFSCGPDSFIQTYAEEIMGEKPMLMLELDEHGADAGYVTRLEAFADVIKQNETKSVPRFRFDIPAGDVQSLKGRTVWLPPMADAGTSLLAASMRPYGYDTRPLPNETAETFLIGRNETRGGECLPCPATLGTFFATVEREGGGPDKHALFMPTAEGPCRFGQYCTLDRLAMNRKGWQSMPIMSLTSTDSYGAGQGDIERQMWRALVMGDVLFKTRCRIAPYETREGETEALYESWIKRLSSAFAEKQPLDNIVNTMREEFLAIETHEERKPLVGIVGEIYVRQNRFTNQDVVRRIEQAGGEAWLAPISEWIIYTSFMEQWLKGQRRLQKPLPWLAKIVYNHFLTKEEKALTDKMSPILDDRHEPPMRAVVESGERFVPRDFEGETIITLGRAIEFMKGGASLVVNCAPFGCMPGAVTSGIFQQIQKEMGIPVANMFYDGEGDINGVIDTYLSNVKR